MEQQGFMDLQAENKDTRSFYCPCGKVYRSYPALYTHVRNKHDGKTPGLPNKPEFDSRTTRLTKKTSSRSTLESQKTILSSSAFSGDDESSNGNMKNPSKEECISKIAEILEGLPQKEISKRYMNQMRSITEMNVYLSTRQVRPSKDSIGEVLAELLEELSKKSEWSRFRYCFALLMVYVELILQKVKQESMIDNISADILCLYVNQFLDGGAQEIALSYDINGLDIFEKETMLAILFWLFRWMLEKGYISYKIGLNPALYPSKAVTF